MPACHAGDRRFESGRVRHHSRISLRPVRPPGRGVPSVPLAASPRDAAPDADRRHPSLGRAPACSSSASAAADDRRRSSAWAASATPSARRRPPRRCRRDAELAGDRRAADPSRVGAGAARRADAGPATPVPSADVAIVPVTHFRTTATRDDPRRGRGRARRNERALRRARARRGRGRRDPRRARRRAPRRRPAGSCSRRRRRDARREPRRGTASASAFLRADDVDARPSARWAGATGRCSASTGSTTSRTGR